MIDLTAKLAESSASFTEGVGGSIKGILNNFLDNHGSADANSKQPTSGIPGYVAKGANAIGKGEKVLEKQILNRGSIIAKASRSVIQFPLYVSQSSRIAEAHPIGKAFERVYASFVQNVIAQNPVITDISKVNGLRFLKDYHTNIKESSAATLDELMSVFNEYATPIDQFDEIMTESILNELKVPGGTMSFIVCRPNTIIGQESARLAHEPLEGFRYLREAGGGPSRNTTTNVDKTSTVTSKPEEFELTDKAIEADIKTFLNDLGLKRMSPEGSDRSADVKQVKDHITKHGQIRSGKGNIYQVKVQPGKTIRNKDGDVVDHEPSISKITLTRRGDQTTVVTKKQVSTSDQMQAAIDAPVMIRDTDVKKFNGMQPFQFTVKFRVDPVYDRVKDNSGNETEVLRSGTNYEQSYILGVKTVMHLIKVKDLADDLKEIIAGDQKNLQSVRYKTGEISWLKDYMFNLPSLKSDAMKSLDDRRWLATLKRLGEYEKIHGTLLKGPANAINNDAVPIPNATMILTRGDIERLKDITGIDLENIKTVRTLCHRLFLIGFVIIDQTAGSFKVFFPDMDNDWDVQSIGAIDAEVAKIDNSPLMAEINRISRKG